LRDALSYIEILSLDYPLASLIFVVTLPFLLSWSVYYLVITFQKLSKKAKIRWTSVILYGLVGLIIANFYEGILDFIFGAGGLSILAIGGVLLAILIAFGLLVMAARFYIIMTEDAPAWVHLLIAILAPPLIIVMVVSVILIYKEEKNH